MKTLTILAAACVLLACSTASAQWVYLAPRPMLPATTVVIASDPELTAPVVIAPTPFFRPVPMFRPVPVIVRPMGPAYVPAYRHFHAHHWH